jgi:hypothetical protein
METYTELKEFMNDPGFEEQKQKSLSELADVVIDEPIIGIIKDFNQLPYCFTLQSCYGHFLYEGQRDPNNLDPLPVSKNITQVEYRIAYVALCIKNNDPGRKFFEELKMIPEIDPQNIQFCCAEWFWKSFINSYALQVEPDRFKHKDTAVLDYQEALSVEKVRNKFFAQLMHLLQKQLLDFDRFDHFI